MVLPPKDRYSVRRVLDSADYIMYSTAVEQGFLLHYGEELQHHTWIKDAAEKILMLAAETIVSPEHSIPLNTGIEMSDKEIRDAWNSWGRRIPRRGLLSTQLSPGTILLKVREGYKREVASNSLRIHNGGNHSCQA
ncbi:MAG: hypothetical protein QXU18_11950 [Thermoplasmatales archaeon]